MERVREEDLDAIILPHMDAGNLIIMRILKDR